MRFNWPSLQTVQQRDGADAASARDQDGVALLPRSSRIRWTVVRVGLITACVISLARHDNERRFWLWSRQKRSADKAKSLPVIAQYRSCAYCQAHANPMQRLQDDEDRTRCGSCRLTILRTMIKEFQMPKYLFQVNYVGEGVKGLL